MSFWDDQAGYDIRDRKHPNYANAGRNMGGTPSRRNPPSDVIAVDGVTRYACPLGCGHFASMTERDLHVLTEHDRTAA